MIKKIEISLENDNGAEVEHRKNDKNLAQIRVILPSGKILNNEGVKVELGLSQDSMIGLGRKLLKAAYSELKKKQKFWHIRGFDKTLLTEVMGIYLEPNSCELIIFEKEYEKTVKDFAVE